MCASLHRQGAPTRGPPGGEDIDGSRGPPGGVSQIGGMTTRGTDAGLRLRSWPRGEVLAVWQQRRRKWH
jgi:hypothetical protein